MFFLLAIAGTQAAGAPERVGFKNVALKPDERNWHFYIELKEGRIVALAKVPTGWEISLESFGERGLYHEGGGVIRGDAGIGHDAWTSDMLAELGPFLLFDESRVNHLPAVLSGWVKISGVSGDDRVVQLGPENFTRTKVKK